MLSSLMEYQNVGLFLVRVVLAVIFVYHAYPKLKKPEMFAAMLGGKTPVLVLGLVEFLAGLSVLFGFMIQLGALAMVAVMAGAMYFKISKWKVPFFAMDKTGWEYDLVLLVMALAILFGNWGTIFILG